MEDIKGLKVIHVNIRSLEPKMVLLKPWVALYKPNIITISETWLSSDIPDSRVNIANYVLYRSDRCSRSGGGVAIYVSNDLVSELITPTVSPLHFEGIFVKIHFHENKYLTIGSIYRPPSSPVESFNCMISTINSIPFRNELLLLGDFNKNYLHRSCSKEKNMFNDINLTQLITEPTRITPSTQSLLDWILVSHPNRILKSGVLSDCFSDHSVIYCIWKIKLPKSPPRLIKIRQYKKLNLNAFVSDMIAINWDRYQLIPNVQDAWDFFCTEFTEVVDKHAPWKTVKVRGQHLPWVSPELIQLFRQRDKAWATFRRTRNDADWEAYRQLRNKSKTKTRDAKANYYKDCLSRDFKNPKQFWKKMNSVMDTSDKHDINQIRSDNIILNDTLSIAQAFIHHFSSVGSSLVSDSYLTPGSFSNGPYYPNLFTFRKISPLEVQTAINELKTDGGAGLDGIENRFLKLVAHIIMYPLADLFNLSLSTCELPAIFKSSRIIPLHKGGDVLNLDNYRPISIICSTAKILEKLVYNQLSQYIATNNILSEFQSGFRPNHSTTTALLKLTNDIYSSAGKGQLTGAIFIDLSKAFDLVDRYLLLDKLYAIGLSNNPLLWFNSYLHNRKQCVVLHGVTSDMMVQPKGVPQGSTLGPLLFSIYVNNLPTIFKHCCSQLYADDTVIYTSSSNLSQIQTSLQHDYDILQTWLLHHKLLLNKSKSFTMLFGTRSKLNSITGSVIITSQDGSPLHEADNIKYLGVWLDPELTFQSHINHVLKKVNFGIHVLYKSRNCFSFDVRKKLALQLILPLFDYCDVVYQNASKSDLVPLNTAYNRLCRFVLGCPFLTHHCTMYDRLQWPPLQARRQMHWLQFLFKCIYFNYPTYLKRYLIQIPSTQYTRHSTQVYFTVPFTGNNFGKNGFAFKAPTDWNNLPSHIRSISVFPIFKRALSSCFEVVCSCFR